MAGIGVFLCTCGKSMNLDFGRLAKELEKVKGVRVVEVTDILCGKDGIPYITQHLRWDDERKPERVVIGACGRKEGIFEEVIKAHGLEENDFDIVNIRELCGWVHEDKKAATEKAKAMLEWQLTRPRYAPVLVEVPHEPSVLVIGGINAVRLAEELSRLRTKAEVLPDGGYIRKDCNFCVSSELCDPYDRDCLYQVGDGIYTNRVLSEIKGARGKLEVKLQRQRGIDMAKCMECNKCVVVCPKKAIHIPEDAVSRLYLIGDACDGCGTCAKECPVAAIDLEVKEEVLKVSEVISFVDMPARSGVYLCSGNNPLEAYERAQAAALRAAQFLGRSEKRKTVNSVPELCSNHYIVGKEVAAKGCASCVEACVHGAVSSGILEQSSCVECGTCMGACPQGVIRWVEHPQMDLMGEMETLLRTDLKSKIVMFACKECGREAILEAGLRHMKYPVIATAFVSCLGSVGEEHILRAFDMGADGVMLAGCASGKCAHKEGFKGAGKRVRFTMEILNAFGLGRERIRQLQCNPEEPGKFVEAVTEFAAALQRNGASVLRKNEPIALEVDGKKSRRELLIELLQGFSAKTGIDSGVIKGDYPFGDVSIDVKKCTLCTACANLCSTDAMRSGDSGKNEEGWVLDVFFTHSYCTACNICKDICPEKAIEVERVLDLKRFLAKSEAKLEVELVHCEDCGMPIMAQTTFNKLSGEMTQKALPFAKLCRDCRDKVVIADLLGRKAKDIRIFEQGKRVI